MTNAKRILLSFTIVLGLLGLAYMGTILLGCGSDMSRNEFVFEILKRAAGTDTSTIFIDGLDKLRESDVPILVDILKGPASNDDIREHAAVAVGILGGGRVSDQLIQFYEKEQNEDVRFYLAYAICWGADSGLDENRLADMWRAEESENVRFVVALALAKRGSHSVKAYLETMKGAEQEWYALNGRVGLSLIEEGHCDAAVIVQWLCEQPPIGQQDALLALSISPALRTDDKCEILHRFSEATKGTFESGEASRLEDLLAERRDLLR